MDRQLVQVHLGVPKLEDYVEEVWVDEQVCLVIPYALWASEGWFDYKCKIRDQGWNYQYADPQGGPDGVVNVYLTRRRK